MILYFHPCVLCSGTFSHNAQKHIFWFEANFSPSKQTFKEKQKVFCPDSISTLLKESIQACISR